jgi:hypothetical protein
VYPSSLASKNPQMVPPAHSTPCKHIKIKKHSITRLRIRSTA